MDDSLISEGTRARARAAEQLRGASRGFAPGGFVPGPLADAAGGFEASTPERRRARRIMDAAAASRDAPVPRRSTDRGAAVAVDMEKWRAIQTWASVDSVAASRGRGVGDFPTTRGGGVPDAAGPSPEETREDRARADALALPETLSPITQIAEPPVRVALRAVQPALAADETAASIEETPLAPSLAIRPGDEDEHAARGDASFVSDATRPAWATPAANEKENERGATKASEEREPAREGRREDGAPLDAPADEKTTFSSLGGVGARAAKFHSFGAARSAVAAADAALELETTKRRERDARRAIDKMDAAMAKLRDERDAAADRAAEDRKAAAEAESAAAVHADASRRLGAEAETLRARVTSQADALEANARELAELRSRLETTRRDGEKASAEAKALEKALAEERRRAKALDDAMAASRETLDRVASAAGGQLEQLREEVQLLRARLAASNARDDQAEERDAEIAALRRELDAAVAGVDGSVATALRRARAGLRRAGVDADGDANEKLPTARLEAEAMVSAIERASEALAGRLADAASDAKALEARLEKARAFEAGAAELRARVEASAETAALKSAEADAAKAAFAELEEKWRAASASLDDAYAKTARAEAKARNADAKARNAEIEREAEREAAEAKVAEAEAEREAASSDAAAWKKRAAEMESIAESERASREKASTSASRRR